MAKGKKNKDVKETEVIVEKPVETIEVVETIKEVIEDTNVDNEIVENSIVEEENTDVEKDNKEEDKTTDCADVEIKVNEPQMEQENEETESIKMTKIEEPVKKTCNCKKKQQTTTDMFGYNWMGQIYDI